VGAADGGCLAEFGYQHLEALLPLRRVGVVGAEPDPEDDPGSLKGDAEIYQRCPWPLERSPQ
jgi:hypothetical protein